MRIGETAPHLTAAAQESFQNIQSIPQNSFDHVIPASSALRFFFERGQKFGLFSDKVIVELDKTDRAWDRHYNCATIEIAMPQGRDFKGETSQTFSIFKDTASGLYYTGNQRSNDVQITSEGMDEKMMGIEMLMWSRNVGDYNPSKQAAFLDTFSEKPVPESRAALRALQAVAHEVTTLLRRAIA